jgi:hypothetical protein
MLSLFPTVEKLDFHYATARVSERKQQITRDCAIRHVQNRALINTYQSTRCFSRNRVRHAPFDGKLLFPKRNLGLLENTPISYGNPQTFTVALENYYAPILYSITW